VTTCASPTIERQPASARSNWAAETFGGKLRVKVSPLQPHAWATAS
jgi:hypothetical protein